MHVSSRVMKNSSFRDPSGAVFTKNGSFYRSISDSYQKNYNCLLESGLYNKLVEEKLLISHQEVSMPHLKKFKVIKPVQIPFISYPYEWCFSQLKDAALVTLKIQKIALDYGMCLKDASAYNIQFIQGKPVLIDTLSFERYIEGQPWVAYRQFCMHFLAPLLLMSYKNIGLNKLLQFYIDGVPLNLVSALLPTRALIRPAVLAHIYLHSKAETYFGYKKTKTGKNILKKISLVGLIENLESLISSLKLKDKQSLWSDYYQKNNYTKNSMQTKTKIVSRMIQKVKPKITWDLGSNTGIFSHLASKYCKLVVSLDFDPLAVESNYLHCKKNNTINCFPLVCDLTNPSPPIGWSNEERMSLTQRGPADLAISLALIHHLAISHNIPFNLIAGWLKKLCKDLIIEFIPKEDSQVKLLLQNRQDIFYDYNQDNFEFSFSKDFTIQEKRNILACKRYIYLMRAKS